MEDLREDNVDAGIVFVDLALLEKPANVPWNQQIVWIILEKSVQTEENANAIVVFAMMGKVCCNVLDFL